MKALPPAQLREHTWRDLRRRSGPASPRKKCTHSALGVGSDLGEARPLPRSRERFIVMLNFPPPVSRPAIDQKSLFDGHAACRHWGIVYREKKQPAL